MQAKKYSAAKVIHRLTSEALGSSGSGVGAVRHHGARAPLSRSVGHGGKQVDKIKILEKSFSDEIAPKHVWRPGSARTRWGA